MKGIMQSLLKKDFVRYMVYTTEKSVRQMRLDNSQTGRNVSQHTFIADMDQLSIRNMSYKPGTALVCM